MPRRHFVLAAAANRSTDGYFRGAWALLGPLTTGICRYRNFVYFAFARENATTVTAGTGRKPSGQCPTTQRPLVHRTPSVRSNSSCGEKKAFQKRHEKPEEPKEPFRCVCAVSVGVKFLVSRSSLRKGACVK
uniref:Uncharacterized protein n=1 Tax=Anopheles melas TaxID=34690 RepID=A0A182TWF8_9DIPT